MARTTHLENLLLREFRSLLRSGGANVAKVVIHYEAPIAAEEADLPPWLEAEAPEPGEARTKETRALIHYISPESISARGWTQIRQGDIIADFDPALALEDYRNPRFEIQGRYYAQKDAGTELTECWDTLVGGRRLCRTVLLSLAGA